MSPGPVSQIAKSAFLASQRSRPVLTGRELTFDTDAIIVSKTDTKGVIRYVNDVFVDVSQYREAELLGAPHSILRHPAMPRCVFKLMWDTISAGNEIFAYVVNRAKSGDAYWVFAHVTPSFDEDGRIVGYHSSRRKPDPATIERVRPIYAALLAEEAGRENKAAGLQASSILLQNTVAATGMRYEEFIFSLAA